MFMVIKELGMYDTVWAVILPGAISSWNLIVMRTFFQGIPVGLEEAALIDGASPFTVLFCVILPLLKPSLATVGLFSIVGHWNDWFGGLIYMQNNMRYPLQTYLQTLLRNFEQIIRLAQGDYAQIISMMDVRTGRAAQLFLGALPIMLIYPFLQKYFTTGLVMGSVKG